MVRSCAVCKRRPSRSSSKENKTLSIRLSFFKFPVDESLRKEWIAFVRKCNPNWAEKTTNFFVCSLHFSPEQLVTFENEARIRKDIKVVPSIYCPPKPAIKSRTPLQSIKTSQLVVTNSIHCKSKIPIAVHKLSPILNAAIDILPSKSAQNNESASITLGPSCYSTTEKSSAYTNNHSFHFNLNWMIHKAVMLTNICGQLDQFTLFSHAQTLEICH